MTAREIFFPGTTAEELANLTGAHITSARRWKREGAPPAISKLLSLLIDGDLSAISPEWKGWRLKGARLIGYDGLEFERGEIMAIPYTRERVHSLERARKFEVQADWIEGGYVEPVSAADRPTIEETPQRLHRESATVSPIRKLQRRA